MRFGALVRRVTVGILDDPLCLPVAKRFTEWNTFMEGNVDFLLKDSALHTRSHCMRVLLLALMIGNACKLKDDDLDALAAMAVFHDSRRESDMLDHGHGKRAAEYYKAFCARNSFPVFDERVYAVISQHDCDDKIGVAECKKLGQNCVDLYLVFKDADGLDRLRLGSKMLDPSMLRTKAAVDLIPFAQKLLKASKS